MVLPNPVESILMVFECCPNLFAAYLSDDPAWSIDDEEIEQTCRRVTLNAHNGNPSNDLEQTITSMAPPLASKDWWTIVRSRSNIRDLNLENNIGIATSPSRSELPEIVLETVETFSMPVDGTKFFRVSDVDPSKTLVVSITSDTDADFNEVYVSFDEVPSLAEFGASGREFLRADQIATIPQTNEGSYYIMVRNTGRSDTSTNPSQVCIYTQDCPQTANARTKMSFDI